MRLPTRHSIALLALVLAACASGPLQPATADLAPWTTQLRARQPDGPWAAVYRRDGVHLVFVAAEHETLTDSPTFRLIEEAFARFDFDVVIVEGYPASKGANPPRLMEYAKEAAVGGFQEGGESVPAVKGALAQGAEVWGGEPDDADVRTYVESRGFAADDVLAFYVLRVIPQWIRERQIDSAGDPRVIPLVEQELLRSKADLGIDQTALGSFARWNLWYQNLNGKPLGEDFSTEEAGPLQDGQFGTNRIAAEVSRARDAFLHEQIIGHLRKRRNLLVVFGGSHLMIQRPALDAALGRPCHVGASLAQALVRCR